MRYTSSRRSNKRKVLSKDKKSRLINILSHVNTNHSNHLKESNIDFVESMTISSSPTLEYVISSNILYNDPMRIDNYSSVSINEYMSVLDDINEKNYPSTSIKIK